MLKNGIYNLIGAILRLGVIIGTIPLLIRLIGVQEYGLWTLVNAAVSIATLAEVGLSISTTVFLAKDLAADDNKAISETLTITLVLMLALATIVAIFLWFGSGLIVNLFSKLTPQERITATNAIQIGSIIVWSRLIQQVLSGLIQAMQRYALLNIVNTLQAIVTNITLVLIAAKGGLTAEMTLGLAIVSVLFFLAFAAINVFLLRGRPVSLRFSRSKFRQIGNYSLLTWVSSIGGQFFSQGDRIIVGAMLGTTVLGVYAAITSVTVQITALTSMAISPLLPRLSAMWHNRLSNQDAFYPQLEQATALNSFVTLGSGSLMFVLGPYLLHFMLPDASTPVALLAFQIATLVYAIYLLNAVGYYLLFAIEAVRSNLVINFVSGILALLLVALGAYFFGLTGAVLGNAGYAASLLFVYWGLHYVGLPFRHWLRWVRVPVLWFVSVVVINLLIGDRFELRIGVYSLQVLFFLGWFWHSQREAFQPFLQKIQLKLNREPLP